LALQTGECGNGPRGIESNEEVNTMPRSRKHPDSASQDRAAAAGRVLPEAVPVRYAGLCEICDHAPTCTFPRPRGVAVKECDEWTGLSIEAPSIEIEPGFVARRRRALVSARPVGLCASCEAAPTCRFSRTPGGVWHCDEYR
ncbi:MAG TPA: hypothetical protein VFP98_02285, partial [Candidatus Polarisedimenticolia bacterium]|nr:hypothetical protein [Candidatus Polarisedimenticolia bacterium]